MIKQFLLKLQQNKKLELLREGIGICVCKVYPAKTIEDADRKIEFLKGIRNQVNEFK